MSLSIQAQITMLLDMADRLERKGAFSDAEAARADAVALVGDLGEMVWGRR